ncbi:hypothetical protein Ssi02_42310 [Sinosporangium siamense]|uniref:Uncharacterized protein n=1 Tax=Sinosporangium siamense TaxID=1367973 RepID=A0A919RHJ0_9ACTN|nr:hypothetical protein Ssi02_42310 [Sinosporangium siamense]
MDGNGGTSPSRPARTVRQSHRRRLVPVGQGPAAPLPVLDEIVDADLLAADASRLVFRHPQLIETAAPYPVVVTAVKPGPERPCRQEPTMCLGVRARGGVGPPAAGVPGARRRR